MIESWNIHMNGRFSMKNIEITGHTLGVLRRPFRQLTVLLLVFATMGLETWSVAGQTQARPATVVRPLRMVPAQPATASPLMQDGRGEAAAPSAPSAIRIDDEPRIGVDEAARLKQIYDALPPDEQADMRNFYESMEIDLLGLFMTEPSVAGRPQPLLPLVTGKNFARTPQTVLSARTRLGLVQQDRPEDAATPAEVAEWLHMNVMAGEWQVLEWFLAERAGDEAPGIYSHVIQSTNQGDPMLLPEEVLALANAASGEPTDWQIDVLGQLLKQASTRSPHRSAAFQIVAEPHAIASPR